MFQMHRSYGRKDYSSWWILSNPSPAKDFSSPTGLSPFLYGE